MDAQVGSTDQKTPTPTPTPTKAQLRWKKKIKNVILEEEDGKPEAVGNKKELPFYKIAALKFMPLCKCLWMLPTAIFFALYYVIVTTS